MKNTTYIFTDGLPLTFRATIHYYPKGTPNAIGVIRLCDETSEVVAIYCGSPEEAIDFSERHNIPLTDQRPTAAMKASDPNDCQQ